MTTPDAVPTTRPAATPLRWLAAVLVAASAVIHLYLAYDYGLDSQLGPPFAAQGVVGLVIAVLVLLWRSPLPLLAAVLFGLGSIAAFFLAPVLPFIGVTPPLAFWPELVTKIIEAAAAVVGVLAWLRERR